jgi:hypothetical protein
MMRHGLLPLASLILVTFVMALELPMSPMVMEGQVTCHVRGVANGSHKV